MSQVFERNRKEADSDYLSLAVDIRIEVLSLVMRESVVPKRKRIILGAPIAETARSLVYNVNRANRFYPSNSYNVLERKRYLGLALADCDQLEQDFQCLIAMKCTTASELERISGMIRDEADKVSKKRKYTRIIGRESAEGRLAAAKAEAERLVMKALDDERLVALTNSLIDACGDVGLGLGSEPNQILAVALPNPIDHWAEEMAGLEATGRYMDDSYYIDISKDKLKLVLACIEILCDDLGITINKKKTRIVKLSRGFRFLKKRFYYGPTGKVVVRPSREAITRERRKLKAMLRMLDRGEITLRQINQSYQSWRGVMLRLDAHETVLSMDRLYKELFGNEYPPPERKS